MFMGFWWGNPTTRNHWEDRSIDGRIIWKWILMTRLEGVDWIELAQDRDKWQSCGHGSEPFGSIKCRRISWLYEKLLVVQEGLCFMQLATNSLVVGWHGRQILMELFQRSERGRLTFHPCITWYFLIIHIFVYNITSHHSFCACFRIDKLWRENVILLLLFHSACADSTHMTSSFVCIFQQCKECKGKLVPVHALKAYSGSRGVAPLIFNLGTRWNWVVNFMPGKKLRYQLNMRLGGPHSRSRRFGEEKACFLLPGFELLFFQAVGYSLYWLTDMCFVRLSWHNAFWSFGKKGR